VKRDVKLEDIKPLEEATQRNFKHGDIKGGLLGEIAPEPPEEESPRQQFRHLPTYERLRKMREELERKKKEMREQHEAKRQELKKQQRIKQQPQMQSTQAYKIQYQ